MGTNTGRFIEKSWEVKINAINEEKFTNELQRQVENWKEQILVRETENMVKVGP